MSVTSQRGTLKVLSEESTKTSGCEWIFVMAMYAGHSPRWQCCESYRVYSHKDRITHRGQGPVSPSIAHEQVRTNIKCHPTGSANTDDQVHTHIEFLNHLKIQLQRPITQNYPQTEANRRNSKILSVDGINPDILGAVSPPPPPHLILKI